MFESLKASILFERLLKRPDIDKAYKMVPPTDSWYDTISTVHNSLAQIRQLPSETLHIKSHDGYNLQAIYYPGSSNKTMIWVHGYTSHAERESAFPGLFYHSLGYNVLIPYLRAHGPSEGMYIAFGALEYRDMMLWVDAINDRHPDGSIVLHGLSMGGGIVLDLAHEEMKNVKCLICDAPSHSVPDFLTTVSNSVFKKDGPKVAKKLFAKFHKEFQISADNFDRVKNIVHGKYPLLLSAGELEQMDALLQSIKIHNPNDTDIVILPGCSHGNGMYKQTERYQGAIRDFLAKYMEN